MQTLKWVFQRCFALGKRIKLYKGNSNVPRMQGLSLYNEKHSLYLASSQSETLHELGVEDGSVYSIGKSVIIPLPQNVDTSHYFWKTSNTGNPQLWFRVNDDDASKTVKRKVKKHKKTKRKRNKNTKQDNDLDFDALRQLHSKAMEPTFDEMRPILKNIRDKLTALTLKKTAPKERNKVVGKGKENELSSSITNLSLIDDTSGGKAGKTVYPILVGETTNLFKTRQLRLSKISTVTTLDLHGCSRYKAIGLLRKSLAEWVDKAMKGDYVRYLLLDSFH